MPINGNRKGGHSRASAGVIILCAGLLTLAGCSPEAAAPDLTDPDSVWQGGQTASSAAPNSPSGAIKNISLWTLPLDEFTPAFDNLDNYAEQLLLASCLSERGMKWPVPWQDVEEQTSPVYNATGRRLFDLEIAQQYGFRTNLAPSKSVELWETFLAYRPTEPGFQDAFDACLVGIREQHPILAAEDAMTVTGLAAQVQQEAFLDTKVQEAAEAWRLCMEPGGFGQLPENPDEFPSAVLLEELGSVPPFTSTEPSERETEVAVMHATCLDSSGFSAVIYETEWALQKKAISRDQVNLGRIRDAVQARELTVQEIIAANAPSA